ncbi:sulfatase-like hydrolase/transferase [Flavobacterium hibisci]|uniref:sulfatase-like hydrolase/transferase n=1 Tax=Flavobacterium hibisci TaxID=1914462 RepID=UPI001CBC01AF|nr:sulfatase-like hydrolase/transferase [Flavobacterium hibisci]
MTDDILSFYTNFIGAFSITYIIFYSILAGLSYYAIKKSLNTKHFLPDNVIIKSNYIPGVSIVAPAFNEGATVVNNVKSLLSLNYPKFEIILVNDGSSDGTLEKLIKEFELVKVDFYYQEQIKTHIVRGHYKSTNPLYHKLLVVDKENARSKADAVNVGINSTQYPLFICTDVDCILKSDTIIKLAKPFIESKKRVIATGAGIRISNSCEVKNGFLVKVHFPKGWLPRFQELEYVRAFLFGRMAWSKVNGLLLVSGALGMFDKEIAIAAGGYFHKSLGEDMELVTRMRKYMYDYKLPFSIQYIPESLCWTEVPATREVFIRQRVRWSRGLVETLFLHKNMFFNPKYQRTAFLIFPYFLFFEFLIPILEVIGAIVLILCFIFFHEDYVNFIYLTLTVYFFYIIVTFISILLDDVIYKNYANAKEIIILVLMAIIEPFCYHPICVYASLKGYYNFFSLKEQSWGNMKRQGFDNPVTIKEKENFIQYKIKQMQTHHLKYLYLTTSLVLIFWLSSFAETYLKIANGITIPNIWLEIGYKLANDFLSAIAVSLVLLPLFIIVGYINKTFAIRFMTVLFTLVGVIQFALVKYSSTTLVNLGADLLGYSFSDMYTTVTASESLSFMFFLPFFIIPLVYLGINFAFTRLGKGKIVLATTFVFLIIAGVIKIFVSGLSDSKYENKLAFITKDIIRFERDKSIAENVQSIKFKSEYPMLKPFKETPDVLAPYFTITNEKPNIVVIVVEGLGAEFIGKNEYAGFTPYLDSMIPKSLYWENFLSNGGRTFAVLSSLLGSLTYGQKGFLELNPYPRHLSLINVLKANGYTTSFYSGDNANFDRKINFLDQNGIDNTIDKSSYGSEYTQTKANSGGFSWGYPDAEIFTKALIETNKIKVPRLDIIQTLTNHEPFDFPEKNAYLKKIDGIIDAHENLKSQKDNISSYKDIFACLNYTDNSIKNYMEAYAKRPDYKNTIFIITGDHRLIPITQKDKLCRFHVPLYIFSPMLKKTESFKSVSSHWDVTPSLVSFLFNNYKFNRLDQTAWMGKGLDTAKEFRNTQGIPLTRNKGTIDDYVYKEYLYSSGELYKIKDNFDVESINDDAILDKITSEFNTFKQLNAYLTQKDKIIPKSLSLSKEQGVHFTKEEQMVIGKLTKGLNPDQMFFKARELAFNKKHKTAILLCDYILNELPNYSDVRTLKGRIFGWDGEYKKAENELLIVIKRMPLYDDAYLALMDVYWWSDQNKKAIETGKLALSNGVKNPEIKIKIERSQKSINNSNTK